MQGLHGIAEFSYGAIPVQELKTGTVMTNYTEKTIAEVCVTVEMGEMEVSMHVVVSKNDN